MDLDIYGYYYDDDYEYLNSNQKPPAVRSKPHPTNPEYEYVYYYDYEEFEDYPLTGTRATADTIDDSLSTVSFATTEKSTSVEPQSTAQVRRTQEIINVMLHSTCFRKAPMKRIML